MRSNTLTRVSNNPGAVQSSSTKGPEDHPTFLGRVRESIDSRPAPTRDPAMDM